MELLSTKASGELVEVLVLGAMMQFFLAGLTRDKISMCVCNVRGLAESGDVVGWNEIWTGRRCEGEYYVRVYARVYVHVPTSQHLLFFKKLSRRWHVRTYVHVRNSTYVNVTPACPYYYYYYYYTCAHASEHVTRPAPGPPARV